ncbi:phage terminase large subunit family protein [Halobacterium wangiae]|nr:phage terminase large subunit family protein [Halobacterium wangiae]
MESRQTVLGDCPHCATTIPKGALLVSYERDGWPAMYAECPDCGDVVHPQ